MSPKHWSDHWTGLAINVSITGKTELFHTCLPCGQNATSQDPRHFGKPRSFVCCSKGCVPNALQLLLPWLQPPASPDHLVSKLHETAICGQYPEEALDFLYLLIGNITKPPPIDLRACLTEIRTPAPTTENDHRYQWLIRYLSQHEQE